MGSHFLRGGLGALGIGVPGNADVHSGFGQGNGSRLADPRIGGCDDGIAGIKNHAPVIPSHLVRQTIPDGRPGPGD